MLDELKNLKYQGGKDGLLFFLCDAIGEKAVRTEDLKVICSHANGKNHLSVDELISYCLALKWINFDDELITIASILNPYIDDKSGLNNVLIKSTVNQLFSCKIFDATMFFYDAVHGCYAFKNECLPLSFSCVRNVLVSQGLFVPQRDNQGTHFLVNPLYDVIVAKYCSVERKRLSLEKLKRQLEDNELAGEKAEIYVLDYERERIGWPLNDKIKRISEIDAAAGYDIVSFESNNSVTVDRFIEVKAISNNGFYWSKNEFEVAKLKGKAYYLYLVELHRIGDPEYTPQIIQDPAISVMNVEEWFVEAQSYPINHV